MTHSFQGGIHPDDKKSLTLHKAIELLVPPAEVVLPVSMHIGAPCAPIVNVGDYVFLGQKIADSPAPVSAPVHATVSGTVKEIAPRSHPNGTKVLSIVIENDGKDEPDPSLKAVDPDTLSAEEIIARIREAGIVGHGGATFPTHVKILSGLGKVDKLIINGAECEPYITSDYRIMTEFPWEVVGGIQILLKLFGLNKALLGIETNKSAVFPILEQHFPQNNSIEICPMHTKYPQGAEKTLIHTLTGRQVPSGKLPADAGCAVFNVDTAGAIYRLFVTGMPVIRRIVTVAGSAISNPKNLEVRIGTPLEHLIDACGGFLNPPNKLIMGGPMMGVAQYTLEAPVIKATNALLAFCQDENVTDNAPKCIRCGRCVEVCPVFLEPTYIYLHGEKGNLDACRKYHALDCIECGACSYACPGKLPLVQGIRLSKARIQAAARK